MPDVTIETIDQMYIATQYPVASVNDLLAINRLLTELTSKPRIINSLLRIVAQRNFGLVVARDLEKNRFQDQTIVGMGTIHWIELPTKVNAYIDDVVVSSTYRGQKIGERITKELIKIAKSAGAQCIDLTSNPKREAANKLYQKLGFVKKETNVYRLNL